MPSYKRGTLSRNTVLHWTVPRICEVRWLILWLFWFKTIEPLNVHCYIITITVLSLLLHTTLHCFAATWSAHNGDDDHDGAKRNDGHGKIFFSFSMIIIWWLHVILTVLQELTLCVDMKITRWLGCVLWKNIYQKHTFKRIEWSAPHATVRCLTFAKKCSTKLVTGMYFFKSIIVRVRRLHTSISQFEHLLLALFCQRIYTMSLLSCYLLRWKDLHLKICCIFVWLQYSLLRMHF